MALHTWTTIPDADIDPESPGEESLFEEMRDNAEFLIEQRRRLVVSNWYERTTGFAGSNIHGIRFGTNSGGAEPLWVAVADAEKLETSPFGITWTVRVSNLGGAGDLHSVAYGGGIWVAVGDNDGNHGGCSSPDGATWTQHDIKFTADDVRAVAYDGSGLFVAAGLNAKLSTSPNGANWTAKVSEFGGGNIYGVAHDQSGLWVIVGVGGQFSSSADGTTWAAPVNIAGGSTLYGVTYGNGLWVIVGATGKIFTSPDASAWTQRASGLGTPIFGVAYHDEMFVATGTAGDVVTSPDGITWTRRGQPNVVNNLLAVDRSGNAPCWIVAGNASQLCTSEYDPAAG